MNKFNLDIVDWQLCDDADPLLGQTTANLKITLGDLCLTEHADIWSRSTRDEVLLSAYPLAIWIASSWWRLHHEVLPVGAEIPPTDWRLSHEMMAANYGYAWPLLMFSTDRNVMNIRAESSPIGAAQSVRYLNGLPTPAKISMSDFTKVCRGFVDSVITQLQAMGHVDSDLQQLWSLILSDQQDPEERRKRRLEAQFGYDPEECPLQLLSDLIAIEDEKGEDVLAELAAVRSWPDGNSAHSIRELFGMRGIEAKPELPELPKSRRHTEPWQRAKADAITLRKGIGVGDGAVSDETLADVLGISRQQLKRMRPTGHCPAAVAGRIDDRRVRFVASKRHPVARRFELTRLLGGYADAVVRDGHGWLAATSAVTERQKYQRAFAAEFLCPIESLTAFLEEDFSDDAVERAADKFKVSGQNVFWQLVNNQCLPAPRFNDNSPYSMVA